MNILVTGGTGFLGRHLIPQLLKHQEYNIILICRDLARAKSMFSDKRLVYIPTDKLSMICRYKPEIIIHLAAKLTARGNEVANEEFINSNITFGVKLLDALSSCNTVSLFINFGTVAEYKLGAHKIYPANFYGATKVAFEKILDLYSNLNGFKYVHLIPYTIYGGIDTNRKALDIILESIDSPNPVKMSGGEQVLDFINVKDIVSFIVFLIQDKKAINMIPNGERLHLGSGIGHSLRQVAAIVEELSLKKCNIEWGALDYRPSEIMHAVAPIGELLKLGWSPSSNLEKDLKQRLSVTMSEIGASKKIAQNTITPSVLPNNALTCLNNRGGQNQTFLSAPTNH